jgi:aerobic carbon-monoxide dehydrogenase medium subunit
MTDLSNVLVPTSADEAAAAFGDGKGTTILAGGTLVLPALKLGRLRPQRTIFLGSAGLDAIERANGTLTIGAMAPVSALIDVAPEPLATFASHVADYEIRGQATIGGNLCAAPGSTTPTGDLQAPLLALDARIRSVGAGGERTESVDDFLAGGPDGRLVLAIEVDTPKRAAAAAVRRPHAHAYTVLAVAAAETANGVRVAILGAGPRAVRATSVEEALVGGTVAKEAAAKALDDVDPQDDALASGWYRRQVLPGLVERALEELR